MKKCDVGGQAIIEGVMMRGSKGLATAIRTPSGKIEVNVKKTKPITKKYKFLNIPIIRGAVSLIDSLTQKFVPESLHRVQSSVHPQLKL